MNKFINIIVILFIIAAGSSCNISSDKDSDNIISMSDSMPIVKFNEMQYNFGKILQGEKVSHTFTIKNIGNANLLISGVNASCGCTTPTFSREPIKPGDKTEIEVTFNSSGRKGKQAKTITIWTNCKPSIYRLQIASEVVII